jgi:hypothetical protein
LKSEDDTSFEKEAHIIPQSLGASDIFENECDKCNEFFGIYSRYNNVPAIDVVIKECFLFTRNILMNILGKSQGIKNQKTRRSEFFNLNYENGTIKLKPKFLLNHGYQDSLAKQLKKGIFKIAIEYAHQQNIINAYSESFDFIRDYVLKDIGTYPVYYQRRKFGAILSSFDYLKNPSVGILTESDEYVNQYKYLVFEILHNRFIIPLSQFEFSKDIFIKKLDYKDHVVFYPVNEIKYFVEVDFGLNSFRN